MQRKIMVEVTEEELKEINKEKTLDDVIDDLLNSISHETQFKEVESFDSMTYAKIIKRKYTTPKRDIIIIFGDNNALDIHIINK